MPFPVLLSTLIRSWFQAQPATLLIPIDPPFLFAVEELYSTRYQSGSFALINVGSGFHCLRNFSVLFFSYMCVCVCVCVCVCGVCGVSHICGVFVV